MLSKRVIACLDVDGGRVVKGVQFLSLRDAGDPVTLARRYYQSGADEVVLLDIGAAPSNRPTMLDVVARAAASVFVPLTVGGGIRSVGDARAVLRAGADKISVNTAAVARPNLLDELAGAFGSQCVVLAIDAQRSAGGGWRVCVNGGRDQTESSAVSWAGEGARRGAGEILLTSMDRDGTQAGYDVCLVREVSRSVLVPVIASGGAGGVGHMVAALTDGEADAVLLASLLHDDKLTIGQVKAELMEAGVVVRPLLEDLN